MVNPNLTSDRKNGGLYYRDGEIETFLTVPETKCFGFRITMDVAVTHLQAMRVEFGDTTLGMNPALP